MSGSGTSPNDAVVLVDDSRPDVWHLRLNRPERLNALGEQVRVALHDAVRRLADHPEVRVCVLGGEGRAFSAGYDLKDPAPQAPDPLARRHAAGAWHRLVDDLERVPAITVARLQGPVVGGGAVLALACDLRVAAPDLRVSIPELAMGIPLAWGGVPRLVREVGLARARDLVLTGRAVDAAEALAAGLVQRVAASADPADLDAAVDDLVATLLALPAPAGAIAKAGFAALGRATANLEQSWADADLLAWSLTDPAVHAALMDYVGRAVRRPRS